MNTECFKMCVCASSTASASAWWAVTLHRWRFSGCSGRSAPSPLQRDGPLVVGASAFSPGRSSVAGRSARLSTAHWNKCDKGARAGSSRSSRVRSLRHAHILEAGRPGPRPRPRAWSRGHQEPAQGKVTVRGVTFHWVCESGWGDETVLLQEPQQPREAEGSRWSQRGWGQCVWSGECVWHSSTSRLPPYCCWRPGPVLERQVGGFEVKTFSQNVFLFFYHNALITLIIHQSLYDVSLSHKVDEVFYIYVVNWFRSNNKQKLKYKTSESQFNHTPESNCDLLSRQVVPRVQQQGHGRRCGGSDPGFLGSWRPVCVCLPVAGACSSIQTVHTHLLHRLAQRHQSQCCSDRGHEDTAEQQALLTPVQLGW